MTKDEIINHLIRQAKFNEALANRHTGDTFDYDAIVMREAAEMIESLTTELEQISQERDLWRRRTRAAVNDMHRYPLCKLCANDPANEPYGDPDNHPCNGCDFTNHWQWRGFYSKDSNKEN